MGNCIPHSRLHSCDDVSDPLAPAMQLCAPTPVKMVARVLQKTGVPALQDGRDTTAPQVHATASNQLHASV